MLHTLGRLGRAVRDTLNLIHELGGHARAVLTAKGRLVGRPSVVNPNQLDYAGRFGIWGETVAQVVAKTGITRTTLYPASVAAAGRITHRRRG